MNGDSHTRRTFLQTSLAGAGSLALGGGFARNAFAAPATELGSPYGELGAFDANGISLPPGFSSRLIATSDQAVPGTGFVWHRASDGMGTFKEIGGEGWYLLSNSETGDGGGGVSAIRFNAYGDIVGAGSRLTGTSRNCSVGLTPWGTLLTCEEFDRGRVFEVDPAGVNPPVARPALGVFQHEAACVDEEDRVYLTEDRPDGCLYRFTPDAAPDLSRGLLEVAIREGDFLRWAKVPDPEFKLDTATRYQVAGALVCNGGEGMAFDRGVVYFSTKGDQKIWAYTVATRKIELRYRRDDVPGTPLREVDNITISRHGDMYICEDGDNFEMCMITAGGRISAVVRLDPAVHGAAGSNEVTGVQFCPYGDRMYFAAQRSFTHGAIYEIRGPFRGAIPSPVRPATTPPPATTTPPPAAGPTPIAPPPLTPARPVDRTKPRVTVQSLSRQVKMGTFLERGLPIRLEISEPAGIELTLRAKGFGVLGRARTTVAVSGRVPLRVRVKGSSLRRRLRRRRARTLNAVLTIRVTDSAGNVTSATRAVKLIPPR
ncbi:MAG: hypothetical protein AVDCRST_MAG85-1538 [uncultured Solirubrobacteraceae bacterium]|uniref:Translocation protein TolB n=1 Tax=uncultured Solirubrobacteraceae bacterium TaxID=1162706 RepID=A0A6J4SEK5_9ACTN|nr:MAG: hypothetical protein AVDCRST_MAG85-1538 [uncultured Solirubrobacteraceae bacterium]